MSLVFSQRGAVGLLTIDRPERRNALDTETLHLFIENLTTLAALETVKVVVVTGSGDRSFCAGGDLTTMTGSGFLERHDGRKAYCQLLSAVEDFPKPIIARVNCNALGGGFGLALACDLVVAVDTAYFGTPEIKVGLFPMMVMALMLRNMPRKKALELMYTGGRLAAREALDIGMINQVVAPAQLDAAVNELADEIAGFSPATLRLGKEAFINMQGMPYREALRYLHTMLTVAANTEDALEGVSAFLQKRPPEWKGR